MFDTPPFKMKSFTIRRTHLIVYLETATCLDVWVWKFVPHIEGGTHRLRVF